MDNSEQLYDKMRKDEAYRDKMLDMCAFDNSTATISEKSTLIDGLIDEEAVAPKNQWKYRKSRETVEIGDRYSKDLSLFYTADDVRSLFNWRRPLYSNICKFMSQQYLGYSGLTIKKKLSLEMQMQSVLTELKVYNLLTEDNDQRELLYEVCKATEFKSKKSRR